jgi:UDP-2,3-diacylglucosamine pyrophosphatase LpxH
MAALKTQLLVISDLHLGGVPATGDKPGFQMCAAAGRAHLVQFLEWATSQRNGVQDVHLVLAGDFVDFLAEERAGGFRSFTDDDRLARDKLASILDDTAEVWRALHQFVAGGGALTLMLGNHDLELSLPGPRRLLLETLGAGRVEFLYDNQAFTLGRVLVEHGNRYDDWNAVPHDDLREARSQASRRARFQFDALPGSRMVIELMNPLKAHLAFVDLLKPETAAVLPFLALLAPDQYLRAIPMLQNRIRALRVRYGPGQQPKDRNFIGADVSSAAMVSPVLPLSTGDAEDDALLELANVAAAGGDPAMAAATGSFLDRWRSRLADTYRQQQLTLLLRVLRAFHGSHQQAFELGYEDEKYLRAATETATRGFEVIVYGHTHRPKWVPLAGRTANDGMTLGDRAVYLNCGTWADVMAVPRNILATDDTLAPSEARARLAAFADDLAANRVDRWRRQLPTFVNITLDQEGRVEQAMLAMLAEDNKPLEVTTSIVQAHLEGDYS